MNTTMKIAIQAAAVKLVTEGSVSKLSIKYGSLKISIESIEIKHDAKDLDIVFDSNVNDIVGGVGDVAMPLKVGGNGSGSIIVKGIKVVDSEDNDEMEIESLEFTSLSEGLNAVVQFFRSSGMYRGYSEYG